MTAFWAYIAILVVLVIVVWADLFDDDFRM